MRSKRTAGWHWRASAVLVVGTLVALFLPTGGDALAKRPVGPPPPQVDGGTIYYVQGGALHQMNPDGSADATLPASIVYWAEPSTYLHGGRWFLQVQHAAGLNYPGTDPNTGAPLPRLELFAVHESGSPVVQLTDGQIDATTFVEPDNLLGRYGEFDSVLRWTAGDTVVSYTGLLTTYDAAGNRTVHDGGIYTVAVDPDALTGRTPTAISGPPLLSLALNAAGTTVLAQSYDWKPDGSAIVYPNHHDVPERLGVWIARASDGFSLPTRLMDNGTHLRWSPDGSMILFQYDGIRSILEDGTDERLLVEDPADRKKTSIRVERPSWSPSGTHVAYSLFKLTVSRNVVERDVIRATADGDDGTQLTAGGLPRWRE